MTVERLLNKLIEKGWRPYEDRYVKRAKFGYSVHFIVRPIVNFVLEGYAEATVPLKEILTSEESGFRQFVCENRMIERGGNIVYRRLRNSKKFGIDKPITHYTFRLLESSLRNKNELEDFLLQNIRIEDESNKNT